MIITVINVTSTADRNADILAALEGHGNELLNVGMRKNGEKPEITYIQTGFAARPGLPGFSAFERDLGGL